MDAVLEKLAGYLEDALGLRVEPRPWQGASLPHFLKEAFQFSEIELLGRRFLLMVEVSPVERAAAALRKQVGVVQAKWDGEVIYVCPRMSAYNRKRLVEQRVPFVVPGNQMYLPTLGIDFREHFRGLRVEPETLSPSAQVLVIHALLRTEEGALTPTAAAARLGYSAMSMTRAFNELEATGIGEISVVGKERHLRLADRQPLIWRKAQALLRSPVKKRVCVHASQLTGGCRAGLTALAEYTLLAPPARPTVALSNQDWARLGRQGPIVEVPEHDPDALEVEVWSYPPDRLADGARVDPLSLYLSLRDSDDERVAASLVELMEAQRW